jgi:hypothetical protein
LADALAEVAGLADVDDAVEAILEEVDAGFVGQIANLGHEIGALGDHALVCHKGSNAAEGI